MLSYMSTKVVHSGRKILKKFHYNLETHFCKDMITKVENNEEERVAAVFCPWPLVSAILGPFPSSVPSVFKVLSCPFSVFLTSLALPSPTIWTFVTLLPHGYRHRKTSRLPASDMSVLPLVYCEGLLGDSVIRNVSLNYYSRCSKLFKPTGDHFPFIKSMKPEGISNYYYQITTIRLGLPY